MVVNPVVEHVRWYDEGSYDNKDPYETILTVLWVDSETIALQGLRGTFNAQRKLELIEHYKSRGVTKAYFERGKDKITLTVE